MLGSVADRLNVANRTVNFFARTTAAWSAITGEQDVSPVGIVQFTASVTHPALDTGPSAAVVGGSLGGVMAGLILLFAVGYGIYHKRKALLPHKPLSRQPTYIVTRKPATFVVEGTVGTWE